MATFRERTGHGDRSAEDRKRHKERVEEAIKKNIPGIIADESIIGVSKDKKIKVPIRGIKEFHFIYGKNQKGVGSGTGKEEKGDIVGKEAEDENGSGKGQGAGDQEGEEIYETEITVEELIHYMFDNMELPDLDRRKLADIELVSYRKLGFQLKGIPPRLAKRKSSIERIKRQQSIKRGQTLNEEDSQRNQAGQEAEDERFPFSEDDLRYTRMQPESRKTFNAVVFCIMDVSGSMDQSKKYLARCFYFLLYQFLRLRYTNVEIVFIAHTTTALEVTEQEFFYRGESGGTKISSGYEKALDIIEERYNPSSWNIYAFHCSDGDNWREDNQKAIVAAAALCEACNMFGYVEIPLKGYFDDTFSKSISEGIKRDNFHIVRIHEIQDVYPALKELLESEGGSNNDV